MASLVFYDWPRCDTLAELISSTCGLKDFQSWSWHNHKCQQDWNLIPQVDSTTGSRMHLLLKDLLLLLPALLLFSLNSKLWIWRLCAAQGWRQLVLLEGLCLHWSIQGPISISSGLCVETAVKMSQWRSTTATAQVLLIDPKLLLSQGRFL